MVNELMPAIREGMWPFRPRQVVLYEEFDISHYRYVISAEARFDNLTFPVKVTIDREALIDDPNKEYQRVSQELTHQLRYRPVMEHNHNVGEN